MYVNSLHLYKVCTFLCILYISVTENSLKTPLPQTQVAVKREVGVRKQVTGAISNSFKRRRDLVKAQVDLGLPTHQLKSETPTRWGSRQQMISRFIEQEKALTQVFFFYIMLGMHNMCSAM